MNSPILHKMQQEISVAFVDDTNFFAEEENTERNMLEILKLHIELIQATEEKIQHEKTSCFMEYKKREKTNRKYLNQD